jgi:hypothetical protein
LLSRNLCDFRRVPGLTVTEKLAIVLDFDYLPAKHSRDQLTAALACLGVRVAVHG